MINTRFARFLATAALVTAAVPLLPSLGFLSAQAQEVEDNGPKVGEMAPDFTLPAATIDGVKDQPLKLSDLRGQTVVLAFFPRARTAGCTAQLESYRDQYATLFNGGNGVTAIMISTDEVDTLHSWAKEKNAPLTFVSDVEGVAGDLYDTKFPNRNVHRRVLFVVAPDGKVSHVMRPFRELSADAYTELADAVKKASGG